MNIFIIFMDFYEFDEIFYLNFIVQRRNNGIQLSSTNFILKLGALWDHLVVHFTIASQGYRIARVSRRTFQ